MPTACPGRAAVASQLRASHIRHTRVLELLAMANGVGGEPRLRPIGRAAFFFAAGWVHAADLGSEASNHGMSGSRVQGRNNDRWSALGGDGVLRCAFCHPSRPFSFRAV